MVGGGGREPLGREVADIGTPAILGSDSGATEALFDAARGFCAAVIGAEAFSVFFVPYSVLSDGVILLLALFANFDTWFVVLLDLASLLLLLCFVGMRLDCLR